MFRVFLLTLLITVHSGVGTASDDQTNEFGLTTDIAAVYFGSRAPGGSISAFYLKKFKKVNLRGQIGFELAGDPTIAIGFEGDELFKIKNFSFLPTLGASWVHSFNYQRLLKGRGRTGTNGETLETYSVADYADATYLFLGLKSKLPNNEKFFFELGFVHQLSFTGKNLREEEIRNCFADDCADSNESGGGTLPAVETTYYLNIGYTFD